MRQSLISLPGLDGTGRLLHRQPRLFEDYDVHCLAYPQDRRALIEPLGWIGPLLPAWPSPQAGLWLRNLFFFPPEIPRAECDLWWDLTADVPLSAFGHRFAMIAALDLRSRLGDIDKPALVLAAPNDRVVPPSAGRDLARRLPNARLVQIPVGHAALVHPHVDVARWITIFSADGSRIGGSRFQNLPIAGESCPPRGKRRSTR